MSRSTIPLKLLLANGLSKIHWRAISFFIYYWLLKAITFWRWFWIPFCGFLLLDQSYFVSIIGEWSPKLFTKVAWTIYIDWWNLRSGFLQLELYALFTSVIFMHTTAFKKGCQITGCLELTPYEKWTMASEDFDMCPDRRAISEDDITAMTTFPFPGGGMRVLSSVLVGPPRFPLVYHYF